MALLTRRKEATAGEDAELQTAQAERQNAFNAHVTAEHARVAAHDPETGASYLDRLTFAAEEMRARNRLADADQRLARVLESDRRRRRERVEELLRPLCREEIGLLKRVEDLEAEKASIIAESGIQPGADWIFTPCAPETPTVESLSGTWRRWLSGRL